MSTPSPEVDALKASIRPRIEVVYKEGLPKDLAPCLLLWLHAAPGQEEPKTSGELERIRAFVEEGGRLLLTGSVAALLGPLGVEPCPPKRSVRVWEEGGSSREGLGLTCFLDHPLFSRFPGGLFLRRPYPGCRIGGAFYEKGEFPQKGRLLGVERRGEAVDRDRGLLFEHRLGKGWILSLGAHLVFQEAGPGGRCYQEERLRFTGDMVDYLCGVGPDWKGLAWPPPAKRWGEAVAGLEPIPVVGPPPDTSESLFAGPLAEKLRRELEGEEAEGASFELRTSDGAILAGKGAEGVEELWGLPLRFLERWGYEGKGLGRLVRMTSWPHGLRRELGTKGGARWVEAWIRAGERSFAGSLENRGKEEQDFALVFGGRPGLCAPYPEGSLGAAELRYQEEGRSFELEDLETGFCLRLDFSRAFERVEIGDEKGGQSLLVRLGGRLGPGEVLAWRLSPGISAEKARSAQGEVAGRSLEDLAAQEEGRLDSWLGQRLRVRTGGSAENDLEASWARMPDLLVRVPPGPQGREHRGFLLDLGEGLGRQFHGPEGLWLSRALLPRGCFEEVRAHLELLAAQQGPSGEIPCRLSPAGPLDYACADSTPLFVEVLGRYVAWTQDLEWAERLFPTVRRALAFLEESDRDGDGISEREGGLTEVSLVVLQAAALDAAAHLAQRLGVPGGGTEWRRHERQLREHLVKRFFDEERGLFAHGVRADGTFDRRASALSLFPLLFDYSDPGQAQRVLTELEGMDLGTPWGVRLLPSSDPGFDPGSEEAGKAVPFLGFLLSLAEMLQGQGARGFGRWSQLLDQWAGAAMGGEEVYGLALGLGFVGEGVLGARPSPDGESLGLRLLLPRDRDRLSFEGLRFRGLVLSGELVWLGEDEGRERQRLVLRAVGQGEIRLNLGLVLPEAYRVLAAREGEQPLSYLLEPGTGGSFLLGEERTLQAGEEIQWEVSLQKTPEIPVASKEAVRQEPAPMARPRKEAGRGLRIAHICHGYPPEFHGGTEHYVQGLARAQKEAGQEPIVIAGRGAASSGVLREEVEGVPVFRLGKDLLFHERWYHGFSPKLLGDLLQVLEEEEVDLVHIHHWMRLSFDLGAWVRAYGIPTVVTLHDLSTTCPRGLRVREESKFCLEELGEETCLPCAPREDWMREEDLDFMLDWFSFAQERELRVGGALLAPSAAQRDFLLEHVGAGLEVQVFPHGSLPSVQELKKAPRPSPPQEGSPLRIAYWGHVQALKGVHLILEAVGRLPDPSRVEVLLWGGADDPFYASQIEELGKDLRLHWKKEFEPEELAALEADLAVFPSLALETWSFVLDEAFAKGLPVLCSDRGALPERVGRAGAVFPAGDAEALAARIQEILEDPGILEAYREQLPSLQPMERHAAELEEIYLGFLKEKPRHEELSAMRKETLDLLEDLKRWEENTRRHEERCRELAGLREKAESERGHAEDELKEALRSIEEHKDRLATEESRVRDLLEQREENRKDLENHKALVKTLQADLQNHKDLVKDLRMDLEEHQKELKRVQGDFQKTEAYLIENKALLEERDKELRQTREEWEKTKNEFAECRQRIQAFSRDLGELREELKACSRRERKLRRENRFAFLLTFPAKILFGLWDRIRGRETT
ncbi:MAG TPA: glycosyltransferase [Planctomycetes bacterium]|nr:glycosyltransferase [Planctomycetota bacterium]